MIKVITKKEGDKQRTKTSMIKVCITTLEERSKTILCPVARSHMGHVGSTSRITLHYWMKPMKMR